MDVTKNVGLHLISVLKEGRLVAHWTTFSLVKLGSAVGIRLVVILAWILSMDRLYLKYLFMWEEMKLTEMPVSDNNAPWPSSLKVWRPIIIYWLDIISVKAGFGTIVIIVTDCDRSRHTAAVEDGGRSACMWGSISVLGVSYNTWNEQKVDRNWP
jgi:hypothetical protein